MVRPSRDGVAQGADRAQRPAALAERAAASAAFLAGFYRDYPDADPVRTVPEIAFVDGSVLIVSWNSVEALEGGGELAELGGNMPIRVDLATGRCRFLGLGEVDDYSRPGSEP
ncbi:hypothetical protein ACQP2P_11805 [Dactylosporangium sp. CA-139114]|uniref:hypothetical protein n=1 Tax=Dactylosporangium sp. CA-139114 TaxID=3239931 RepID=UPI003D95ED74